MKRQSKAEEALRKQVKILEVHMDVLRQSMNELQMKYDNTFDIKQQLEREIYNRNLSARKLASERNKP